MLKKSTLHHILLVFYIFCFLFAPPFVPGINFSFILGAYSIFIIFIKYRRRLATLLSRKKFIKLIVLLTSYIAILVLSFAFSTVFLGKDIVGNFMIVLYSTFLNFVVTFICAIYLIFRCEDLKISKKQLILYFIYAGCIQAGIALLTLISPTVKSLTVSLMTKDTNSYLMNEWLLQRRFYGFANNLLDLFGFGTGIIATIPLFYSNDKDIRWSLLASVFLLISPILNSRSGLVIFAIGIIIWLCQLSFKKNLHHTHFFKYFIGAIVALSASVLVVSWLSPHTLEWIKKDFGSFLDPSSGTGTASAIFSEEFWNLPPAENMLFGAGHNVSAYSSYRAPGQIYSDNGYINEVWKVGLVGLFIFLYIYYFMLKECKKDESNKVHKSFYTFLWVSSLVFMVKGSLMGYNPGNVIIYTLFVYTIYQPSRELKDGKK